MKSAILDQSQGNEGNDSVFKGNRKALVLSPEHISTFLGDGVLVVDNVLSPTELHEARTGLARTLERHSIDVNNLPSTSHNLRTLSSTNGSGGVLDIFYPPWKMNVATNECLFRASCQLWEAAYCHHGECMDDLDEEETFRWHPHGPFDCSRGYAYIDRIGFRLPTKMAEEIGAQMQQTQVSSSDHAKEGRSKVGPTQRKKKSAKKAPIQRSLTPHLDCCPDTIHSPNKSKWRPIQCFVSLTDNMEPNTGGFEAARSFHRTFQSWAKSRPPTVFTKKLPNGEKENITVSAPCIGEYTHIRPKEDRSVMDLIEHIPVRAGSAVFWDNRIPHANAYRNDGMDARAVVYCSFLPDVELNRRYVRRQLEDWKRRRKPRDQWIVVTEEEEGGDEVDDGRGEDGERNTKSTAFEKSEEDREYEFTDLGQKLMGMKEW